MIRILIVDDQNLVQQGIKSLLDRDLDFKVIGTVRDGRQAVQQIAQIHPDIVLLDIEMPGMDGITTTKHINRVSPKTKVIILSSHEEKKYVTQALMAGAKGYILKSSLMNDLKQAIVAVNNGYSQIDSRLLAKVFDPQNVKVKKVRSNPEDATANQNDFNSDNSSKSLSSQDTERIAAEEKRSRYYLEQRVTKKQKSAASSSSNATDTLETTNSTVSKVSRQDGISEPLTVESDTPIQSKKTEAVSSSEVGQLKQDALSKSLSDAVVLEHASPDQNDNQSNGYQKRSSHAYPQIALAPAREKSHRRQNKLGRVSSLFKQKYLAIVSSAKKLSNSLELSSRKLKATDSISQVDRYQAKLLSFLQQGKTRYLLWNIILAVLVLATVIVLGR